MGGRANVDVGADALESVVRHLDGLGVRRLVSHPPTLEELFLRHYHDPAAASPAPPR